MELGDNRVRKELLKCRKDFKYFASRYLKIVTTTGDIVPLRMNEPQIQITDAVAGNFQTMVLKARKLGSSTVIAGYFFWKALFKKNTRVAVVAHTDEAAKELFTIYQHFYKNLPNEMRPKAIKNRHNELDLVTGSKIKIGSADSDSFRGQTYQYIHASEYAFWSNVEKTIASLFQTADANASIVLESTANGLNGAYDLWVNDAGYQKIFLPWMIDDRCQINQPRFTDYTQLEREYRSKENLSDAQFNWMVYTLRVKCANNWRIFHQEFPSSPNVAFVTSGDRFFPQTYDVTTAKPGYHQWEKRKQYHIYSMGVDTASGSPGGDFSTVKVLDVTDKKSIREVASFYERLSPSDFREEVLRIAREYKALAVIESNSYGLSIVEHLRDEEYFRMYRDTAYDKTSGVWKPKWGYNTNVKSRGLLLTRLYEHVTREWIEIRDINFMLEANSLIYNNRGKVEAAGGKHDDMIIATGLALMGLDQIHDIVQEVQTSAQPVNLTEMIKWEQASGRVYRGNGSDDFSLGASSLLNSI
jgi:hypothetical protein|tara:strand:- start:2263 stop:3846 length:1584 start_codon:yes stop_codon:yes gene_type:complete